ncbi:hypothetical protein J1614_009674 [Plenodomus biglobosus]|nr:hypothetical protein J1614_009674 [Plenodomus biglobosus]
MANIDPIHCQFHRVGSDHVQKVIDGISMAHSLTNMASGNGIMPIYSNDGSNPYPRSMVAHQYPQVDTKSVYPSTWTVPYQEDTSPVENYQLDQSSIYLPNPTPIANSRVYGSSCRWNHPMQKQSLQGPTGYMDQDSTYPTNSLPYTQSSYGANAATDSLSPLSSMTSLQMNLPERPPVRQFHASGAVSKQRLLPFPQPSPAQASRVSFDLEHDQRLRSGQATGASPLEEKSSYAKPSLPWSNEEEISINASEAASAGPLQSVTSGHGPGTAEETGVGYLPSTTSISSDGLATSLAPQMQLNFRTSGLLDLMSVTSPATNYSNFRECRASNASSAQMARQSSQNTYYSFDSDHSTKRSSVGGGSPNDGTLASGLRYQPLPHSPSQGSPGNKKSRRDASSNRCSTANRGSANNLNSSFQV